VYTYLTHGKVVRGRAAPWNGAAQCLVDWRAEFSAFYFIHDRTTYNFNPHSFVLTKASYWLALTKLAIAWRTTAFDARRKRNVLLRASLMTVSPSPFDMNVLERKVLEFPFHSSSYPVKNNDAVFQRTTSRLCKALELLIIVQRDHSLPPLLPLMHNVDDVGIERI